MAVVRMKPFLIVDVLAHRKTVLELLQKLECVQISNSNYFKSVDTSKTVSNINSMLLNCDIAISAINKYCSKDKSFFKKYLFKKVTDLDVELAKSSEAYSIVNKIKKLDEEIKIINKNIDELKATYSAVSCYLNFDYCIGLHKTPHTTSIVGSLPDDWSNSELENKLNENIYFEKISNYSGQTFIFFIIPNNIYKKTIIQLNRMGFLQPIFTIKNITPRSYILKIQDEINKLKIKCQENKKIIQSLSTKKSDIEYFSDCLRIRRDKYMEISKLGRSEYTFSIEGFMNPKYEKKLRYEIEKQLGSYFEVNHPNNLSPVDFSNGYFSSPVESVTKTYSMPSQTDLDPNPIMAVFYYLFFGIMFSDAGYGLILSLITYISLFLKKLNSNAKKTARMFFFCGISTMFWGFMFGSFFGNIVEIVSKLFFKLDIILKPLWIDTVKQPLTLLKFCIGLGICQIITGLILNFYNLIRNRKIKKAFFCVLNWILIIFGLIMSFYFGNNLNYLSAYVKNIGLILLSLGIAVTIICSGYESKGIMKIFKGITNLFSLTSYIGDVISYSRLMALGIATGVIASVVNMLGSIIANVDGGGIIGFFLFLIVSIFGHGINFCINILGAYVHTNRLQYVEFFSKFYKGGGIKFNPFGLNTKYIKFLK